MPSNFNIANQAALKSELLGDPKGLGLVALGAAAAADKLNLVGASNEFEAVGTQTVLDSWRICNAIDPAEYAGPSVTAVQRQWLSMLLEGGKVDVSSANIRSGFQLMFAAGPTRTAMLALTKRSISRAEALFGLGISVDEADVIRARAS